MTTGTVLGTPHITYLPELSRSDLVEHVKEQGELLVARDGRLVCVLTALEDPHDYEDIERVEPQVRLLAAKYYELGLTGRCQSGYLAFALSDLQVPTNLLSRMRTSGSYPVVYTDQHYRTVLVALPAVRDEGHDNAGTILASQLHLI